LKRIALAFALVLAGCSSTTVRLACVVGERGPNTPRELEPGFHEIKVDGDIERWAWGFDDGKSDPPWLKTLAQVGSTTITVTLRFAGDKPSERIVFAPDAVGQWKQAPEPKHTGPGISLHYASRNSSLARIDERLLIEIHHRTNHFGGLEQVRVRIEADDHAPIETTFDADGDLEAVFGAVLPDRR
jgi:hypothetical protein